jgi:hypothetical protein
MLEDGAYWHRVRLPKILPQNQRQTWHTPSAAKARKRRGFYKGTDGRYKSAGTYDTEQRALEISQAAEKHAGELVGGPGGGLDPVLRATRTIGEYAPVFPRHHRVGGIRRTPTTTRCGCTSYPSSAGRASRR